ncbi:MAG TPA: hypothetical protein PKD51_20310 [Saprospiraceae bacterium]|nr:hypothetical protein [Saprospiraceae bacterium]HMU04218.1 hypothetical protein [Saprospiraceae bacterium]
MAKKFYIAFIVLCIGFKADAQNYILNPSFEDFNFCPDTISQIQNCKHWYNKGLTPDFYHLCGYYKMESRSFEYTQPPYDGQGVSGIGISFPFRLRSDTTFREYIMGTLIEPLVDDGYYFEAYVLAYPTNRTNSLGVYFSIDTVSRFDGYAKSVNPQINFTDWIGSYPSWKRHAACVDNIIGSKYLTIGNFNKPGTDSVEYKDMNFSNLIHLDALGLYKIPKYSQMDTTVDIGYCHSLDTILNGIPIYHVSDGEIIIKEKCFDKVGLHNIKTYVKGCDKLIKETNFIVEECNSAIICSNITIKRNDAFDLKCAINGAEDLELVSFILYDRWGNIILQNKDLDLQNINHPKILNGVFVYELKYKVCNTIYIKYGDLTILE